MMIKSQIGDERFLVEMIDIKEVEKQAKENGWAGGDAEFMRDYCEPQDAALYLTVKTLARAEQVAREWLATGNSFYGSAMISRQTFQQPHDDRGNLVKVPAEWETEQLYEVDANGETMEVAA